MAAVRRAGGFTLTELLVAMTIFAICMASLSKVVRTLLISRERIEQRMDCARRFGSALAEVEQDMACALIPEEIPEGSMKTGADEESEEEEATTTRVEFWTLRPRFVQPGRLVAAAVRVTYELTHDTDSSELNLVRTEYDPLTDEETNAVLISGLEEVSWSFNTGTRYQKDWKSNKKLPHSVRLSIRPKQSEGKEETWDSEFIVGVNR